MKKNLKISENQFLVAQEVGNNTTVKTTKSTNHIFVVDVSGSMYYDLSLIRTQLKNKLSNLMKEGDTISIVWFSGRHDAGILKEEVEVKSLKTLTDLHDAIDRWLQPVGLTAFLKPLEQVKDLIGRIKVNRPNTSFSMIFLSDGYNNDCPWNEVIDTLKSLEDDISASTFVEYGYYADTQKLTQMASILGGEKISCNGFDEFDPVFEAKISSSVHDSKKVVIDIDENYLFDFAYSISSEGSVLLYNINNNQIMVNGDVNEIYYFTPTGLDSSEFDSTIFDTPLYGAIYILADKLLNDEAEKLFYSLGDSYHYKMLINAFGKQKLNSFKSVIKECIADIDKRFPDGREAIKNVPDNTYCLMNLIEDLSNMDNALFYPNHPDFNYKRIGKKKKIVGSELTESDKKRLAEAKDVKEANEIMKELEKNKVDVEFVETNPEKGYPISDLVWNSDRANLSVRVRYDGVVRLPENKFKIDEVASFKYRTYTLIKDGIVNMDKLPVSYSSELHDFLVKNGVDFTISEEYDGFIDNAKESYLNHTYGRTITINLMSIPIINRGMVKSISAENLAKKEWELWKIKGSKKVYNYFKNTVFPRKSETFANMLGDDCAAWLKEIGITDYNGFAPKVTTEKAKDFYMSVALVTKIKGLSSLPKVQDVINKIEKGSSLKLSEFVMSSAIKNFKVELESEIYKTLSEEKQKEVLKNYLENKSNELNIKRRKILQEIAQTKFSLILSKKWFKEFKSFDENTLELNLDNQELKFIFDMLEKKAEI